MFFSSFYYLPLFHSTCQELISTLEADEAGHKILKEAKEESATLYEQFDGTLKNLTENIKKMGEKKDDEAPAPRTPEGQKTKGLKSPEKK